MRRKFGYFLLALLGAILITIAFNPWSLKLMWEGYPAGTWPARGNFAVHGNMDQTSPLPQNSLKVTPRLKEILDGSKTKSFVALKDGKIIYSMQASGYSPDTRFNSFSMVKSLIGVLVLKAIDEGRIAGRDQKLGEVISKLSNSAISSVTIGELMDMRSGIQFEKPAGYAGKNEAAILPKILKYNPFGKLAKLQTLGPEAVYGQARLIDADRGKFSYQNFNTALLGWALEETYQISLDELLDQKIIKPSGAGAFAWRKYPGSGKITAFCCLYATPQWWARVAWFLLKNGQLKEGDSPFYKQATHDYFMGRDFPDNAFSESQYRSQSRYNILDRKGEAISGKFVYFLGQRGQTVWLIPQDDLVVVRFGAKHQLLHSTIYEMVKMQGQTLQGKAQ